jgi:hypothetical protein
MMEKEATETGDLEQAEIVNDSINELREKAILLKNLTIIEENERAVGLTSLRN